MSRPNRNRRRPWWWTALNVLAVMAVLAAVAGWWVMRANEKAAGRPGPGPAARPSSPRATGGTAVPPAVPVETADATWDERQPGVLRGRVYDEETGKGIGNAFISVEYELGHCEGCYDRTDETGSYRIANLRPGKCRTWVNWPTGYFRGGWRQKTPVTVPAGGEAVHDFVFQKGITLRGRVMDLAGQPVSAAVLVEPEGQAGSYYTQRTVANAEGFFTLKGVPADFQGAIWASGADARSYRQPLNDLRESIELVLDIEETARLTGRVGRGETGLVDWVAGDGRVDARPHDPAIPGGFQTRVKRLGRVELSLAPGAYTLYLDRDDSTCTVGQVEVAPGQTRDLGVITCQDERVALSGRVTGKYGLPVWGARVHARNRSYNNARTGFTGRYTLTGLEPGAYEITVRHDDYAPKTGTVQVNGHNRFDVALDPCGSVSGQVVDAASGAPVGGARVFCEKDDYPLQEEMETVSRAGSGAFTFSDVQPGYRQLSMRAPGFPTQGRRVKVVSGAATEVALRLKHAQTFEGTVVDWAGEPVPGAEVTLRWGTRVCEASAVTDADGRFRLADVVREASWFGARHPEYPRLSRELDEEETRTGKARIALERGGTIEGRILLDGAPVAETEVRVVGTPSYKTVLEADGAYRVRGVPAGGVRMSVDIPLGGSGGAASDVSVVRWVEVAPGGTAHEDIDLATTDAMVEGKIKYEGIAEWAAGVTLNFETGHGHVSYHGHSDKGAYRFSRIPAGNALLTASSYAPAALAGCVIPVEVVAGETAQQDVLLRAYPEVHFEPAAPLERGEVCLLDIVPAAHAEFLPDALDKEKFERYRWRYDYLSVCQVHLGVPEEEQHPRTKPAVKGLAPGGYRLVMRRHVYDEAAKHIEGECYGAQAVSIGPRSPQTVQVNVPRP